jgi:nucleotide-binding universal stress UspA family protein
MPAVRANTKSAPVRRLHHDKAGVSVNTTEELRRYSAKDAAGAHLNLQRILVPVDFSRESAKAMRYAVTLARQFDASITLVHVVEPAYGPSELPSGTGARRVPDRERLAKAKSKLGIMGQRILGPCRIVETVIRSGLAFFEITEAAKALASDLIVVGTHGYAGVTRSVMGSTAEKVIRHAPCPVLVVRPNEHEFIE